MIEFNKNEKKLTIPSALGNFSTAVSGGVSEERVVEIVDSAITDYDAQVQQQFSGITDAVSGLSENMQALSGTVSSNTAAIEELSGRTFDVLEPVAEFPASAETGVIVAKVSTEGAGGWGENIFYLNPAWSGTPDTLIGTFTRTSPLVTGQTVSIYVGYNEELGRIAYYFLRGETAERDIVDYDTRRREYIISIEDGVNYAIGLTAGEGNRTLTVIKVNEATGEHIPDTVTKISPSVGVEGAYQYDGTEWVKIGGGDGLVHLETLSGVTGETNVMYECDGELFWWNPDSGYSAEWDGQPVTGKVTGRDGYSFALNYAEIPDGTVILEYFYAYNNYHSRIIKNGDKLEVRYEADNYETVRQSGVTGETITGLTSNGGSIKIIIVFNSFSIIFRPDNPLSLSSFWDGSANTAHWEMATKPENEPFTAQQDGVPIWNKSGKIIGMKSLVKSYDTHFNTSGYGNSAPILYGALTTGRNLPEHMFFPTSGGTAGQVLTSAGDAEPVWADMPSGSKLIYLNLLTEQERIALYNEIMAYQDANMPFLLSSGFPANDYSFYCIFTENWRPFTDDCDGVIKMEVTQIHPTDYGGAVMFTGTAYSRQGDRRLCTLRYIITFDGQTDIYSEIAQIGPSVDGFSFGWGEYAPLKYDVANQQFLQGENETVINPSGATYGIAGSDDINQLLNDGGVSYFTDRQRYGASKYEIVIKDNGTEHKYQNPSIIREEITTKTVDGENFSNKYTFVYTREDGGRFLVKMALGDDNNQYGTDFEYLAL